jgi:hypothetical protein
MKSAFFLIAAVMTQMDTDDEVESQSSNSRAEIANQERQGGRFGGKGPRG